jgi:uncharacterized protein (TIGR03437 family)
MRKQSESRRKWNRAALAMMSAIAALATAQPMEAQQPATVSAASFVTAVAPGSLASVFGKDLATAVVAAALDENGNLPTVLAGASVEVNGVAAGLSFVSPSQINFVVPGTTALGEATVTIKRAGGTVSGKVAVKLAVPGIFNAECLRSDRAAVLNAVTYALEPFRVQTPENGIPDKRTRLSIFATGLRFAGNPDRTPGVNVAREVQVEAEDSSGRVLPMTVEYAGPAPLFFGLDQINVIVPPVFDDIGVVKIRVRAAGEESNVATVLLSNSPVLGTGGPDYQIERVAGVGRRGFGGDGGDALSATFFAPAAIAFDKLGNMYVADAGNHVVRKITPRGVITTFAGTGEEGYSGDGGLAARARLRAPSSLAIDRRGYLYIADPASHVVRVVDVTGQIATAAGTGVAGFSGDGGQAALAQLDSPWAVAADAFGNIVIADTKNDRVRRITSDGRIMTIAGTGEAGYSGDGNGAIKAKLNEPDALAISPEGILYIADQKNHRIRRVALDGTIRTLCGTGDPVSAGENVAAQLGSLRGPVRLALDRDGKLFFSDGESQRVRVIDTNCILHTAAGEGDRGYRGDGGPARVALVAMPRGLASLPTGEVYFADSENDRVRKLFPRPDGPCGELATIVFESNSVFGGQALTGYARLNCAVQADVKVILVSDNLALTVPSEVVIPAGQSYVTFPAQSSSVATMTLATVTGTVTSTQQGGGPTEDEETVSILPNGTTGHGLTLTISAGTVEGGQATIGRISLSTPAPPGGLTVALSSNNPAATVTPTVTIPAGETTAEFLITTTVVGTTTTATITGTSGAETSSAPLTITGTNTGGGTGTIQGLTISPSGVTGGQNAIGTVTLAAPAGPGGVTVTLSSNRLRSRCPPRSRFRRGRPRRSSR